MTTPAGSVSRHLRGAGRPSLRRRRASVQARRYEVRYNYLPLHGTGFNAFGFFEVI